MSESKLKGLIAQAWAKTEQQLSADQVDRRLKGMRRNAELQLAQYLTESENAEAALAAKIESAKTQDVSFADICSAFVKKEEAKLQYEEFVELYKNLFGENPALV